MRQGNPRGVDGIDAYDAACIVLAYFAERYSQTEFTMNPKGLGEVLRLFKIGPVDPDMPVPGTEADADALRAEMAAKKAERLARKAAEEAASEGASEATE